MINLETLTRKLIRTDERTNEKYVDLTQAVLRFNNSPRIKKSVIVSDDLVMRPDAVARIVYGDANKLDYILKFNDISNPFSLDSGDILLIPNDDDMREQFISPRNEDNEEDLRSRLLDPTKFNKKDKARIEYIKQKAKESTNPGTGLPPNFAEPGKDEIEVKDGKIVFGGNVVANLNDCPEPVSRASLKSKLLANKIFRGG